MENYIAEVRKEGGELRKEMGARVNGYILAGVGFVVGLAWNDAIKALIDYLFPLDKNTLLAKFLYALLITIVLVVATKVLLRSAEKDQSKVA